MIDELLENEREFDEIEAAKETENEMDKKENDWATDLKHIELATNEKNAR